MSIISDNQQRLPKKLDSAAAAKPFIGQLARQ